MKKNQQEPASVRIDCVKQGRKEHKEIVLPPSARMECRKRKKGGQDSVKRATPRTDPGKINGETPKEDGNEPTAKRKKSQESSHNVEITVKIGTPVGDRDIRNDPGREKKKEGKGEKKNVVGAPPPGVLTEASGRTAWG